MAKTSKEYIERRRQFVLYMLEKYPDHPTKTLARKLWNDDKNLFPSIESARSAIRYVTGTTGKRYKKYAQRPRVKKAAGQKLELPESEAKPLSPYHIRGKNRILVFSDLHIPYHNKAAIKIAIEEAKRQEVNVIVLLGDVLDCYQLSRWDRDPKKPNIAKEIEICQRFLAYLRQEFPKAQIIWKEGNHEERWKAYFYQNAPEIAVLPGTSLYDYVNCETFKIDIIDERRPIDVSGMWLYHGQELGKGSGGGVNQARGQWMKTFTSTIAGHGHRSSTNVETTAKGKVYISYSIGCLCDLNPNYASVNKWNHGFGILNQKTPNKYTFDNYIILNGEIFGQSHD